MDTRSRQPAGWRNSHEPSDALRSAVEQARALSAPSESLERALERARRLARSRSLWLCSLLWGIASTN